MFFTYIAPFNVSKGDNYAASNYHHREKFVRRWVVEVRKQYLGHQLPCQTAEGSPQKMAQASLYAGQGLLWEGPGFPKHHPGDHSMWVHKGSNSCSRPLSLTQ